MVLQALEHCLVKCFVVIAGSSWCCGTLETWRIGIRGATNTRLHTHKFLCMRVGTSMYWKQIFAFVGYTDKTNATQIVKYVHMYVAPFYKLYYRALRFISPIHLCLFASKYAYFITEGKLWARTPRLCGD